MKRIFAIIIAAVILLSSALPVYSANIGDPLGWVLNTDIVCRIDGQPIRSYNIDGNTYIVVEDLMEYGFSVSWDGAAKKLTVNGKTGGITSEYTPKANTAEVGSRAMQYLYTDITTWLGSNQVTGYNIGGYTCICMDDLAAKYSSGYVWDDAARELSMTTASAAPAPTPAPAPKPDEKPAENPPKDDDKKPAKKDSYTYREALTIINEIIIDNYNNSYEGRSFWYIDLSDLIDEDFGVDVLYYVVGSADNGYPVILVSYTYELDDTEMLQEIGLTFSPSKDMVSIYMDLSVYDQVVFEMSGSSSSDDFDNLEFNIDYSVADELEDYFIELIPRIPGLYKAVLSYIALEMYDDTNDEEMIYAVMDALGALDYDFLEP